MRPHNFEKLVDKSFQVFRTVSAEQLEKERSYKIIYEDRPVSLPHIKSIAGTSRTCTAITSQANLFGLIQGEDTTSTTDETIDPRIERIVLAGIAIGASCALTTMLSSW